MSTLRVSNIEAKADPSSPSVDEKLKVTNSNGDVLVHIDGKTVGVTTVGINTTDRTFTVDAAQNVEFLGIVTATKFSLSGGGEITGGDGNFTGIVTAGSGDYSGGLSVGTAITAVSATFTGDVSIGGTLTYEDVTNIDSIGIITARSNIDAQSDVIVGAGLSVVGISTLANTNINGQLTATNARITGVTTFGTSSTTINGAHEYPSIRPTLDLNFAATKTLDRRITFTRDSLGTYTDELGIVRYAPNNTPRFDHDPTTGESLGLLIEESRTNILGNSTNLTDNNGNDWDNVNGTIAVNQTIAPDGTNTAASFTTTAGNAEHSVVWAELVPTGDVTASVWVKTNTYSIVSFVLYGEPNSLVSYNISTATVYNQASNVSRATIKEYPNGWYRISATMNCTVAASRSFRLFASTGNFNASGTESFYYWGPQVEAGSFETSYIPTFASNTSVTRAADIAKITGTNFTDFYNDTEGTLFIHADKSESSNDMGVTINNMSSVSDNRIELRLTGGNTSTTRHVINSGGTGYMDSATNIVDVNRYSFAFARNNAIPCTNGTLGTLDTVVEMPVGVSQMTIGSTPAFSGDSTTRIRQVSYYNKRLPNAQLQGLTAQ